MGRGILRREQVSPPLHLAVGLEGRHSDGAVAMAGSQSVWSRAFYLGSKMSDADKIQITNIISDSK
jgi:hypothetical protein